MARIRTIKPDHGTNKKVGRLSDRAYRIWLNGLVCQADDEGRLIIDPEEIRVKVYAYWPKVKEIHVSAALAEIENMGLLRTKTIENGKILGQINDWLDHQVISHPTPSKFQNILESSGAFQRTPLEGRKEGNGREWKEGKGEAFRPPTPKEAQDYASSINYKLDGEKFVAFYQSKGWKVGKSPMIDWQAAVVTWKKGESNNGKTKSGGPGPGGQRAEPGKYDKVTLVFGGSGVAEKVPG